MAMREKRDPACALLPACLLEILPVFYHPKQLKPPKYATNTFDLWNFTFAYSVPPIKKLLTLLTLSDPKLQT